MRVSRVLASAIFAAAMVACLAIPATGQTESSIATVSGGGSSAKWDVTAPNAAGTLTVTFPDGRSIRKTFRSGGSVGILVGDKYFESPSDGVYVYELTLVPTSAGKDRAKDDEPEAERAGRKRSSSAPLVQSGSFVVLNGSIVVNLGVEPEQKRASTEPVAAPAPKATASAKVLQQIRNNHRAFFMWDQVIPDDLIVQGSACVGLDCVNNEPFNFDTIRLKENNTRILFLDTSTQGGFPTNDWILKANDSGGGSSYFGIVDHGNAGTGAETGTIVAQFDAGAPANSLRVSSSGKVGVRTATPVLDVHIKSTDTPATRLEQTGGGFGSQTWDIAGNEANFFVRDVTSGSRLPFRIRPGAPTSSIDISAAGDVGIGTASPAGKLEVAAGGTTTVGDLVVDTTNKTVFVGRQSPTAGDNSTFIVRDRVGGTSFFVSGVNSQVGIGTNAPTDTLSVNGTASKPGGGTWAVFSDERLKNVKGNYNSGLKAVMQLQPLRYQYKPDNALGLKSDKEYVGFGAQSLKKVIPEAVTENSNGYLMVNSDPILWTMLNAIKEQQKEIAELKGQIRKLQATSRRHRK